MAEGKGYGFIDSLRKDKATFTGLRGKYQNFSDTWRDVENGATETRERLFALLEKCPDDYFKKILSPLEAQRFIKAIFSDAPIVLRTKEIIEEIKEIDEALAKPGNHEKSVLERWKSQKHRLASELEYALNFISVYRMELAEYAIDSGLRYLLAQYEKVEKNLGAQRIYGLKVEEIRGIVEYLKSHTLGEYEHQKEFEALKKENQELREKIHHLSPGALDQ
ncbi:MAG: hypothetical protein ABI361_02135 [Nitrososphaera sp.]|jgi:hypothetical protein